MQPANGISASRAIDDDMAPEDVQRAAGDGWVVTRIADGYKAVRRESVGPPVPRYGRTLAELLEGIHYMECGSSAPDRLTPPSRPTPTQLAELSRLRTALPGYEVSITSHSPSCRFEAIRRRDETGPWCVISSDAADLWRELAPAIRPQDGAAT